MPVQELRTLPNLQAEMGVSFRLLEKAVRSLNIEPALITNGQSWYDADAVERIRRHARADAAGEGAGG